MNSLFLQHNKYNRAFTCVKYIQNTKKVQYFNEMPNVYIIGERIKDLIVLKRKIIATNQNSLYCIYYETKKSKNEK